MKEFYRAVKNLDPARRNMAVTVLDVLAWEEAVSGEYTVRKVSGENRPDELSGEGAFAGEKALVSDGVIVWKSREDGLFADGRRLSVEQSDVSLGKDGSSIHADIQHPGKDGMYTGKGLELDTIRTSGVYSINGYPVFCDLFASEKKMVICGGGHVSIPMIRMGRMLGFQVHVLEDRPAFADHARSAGASEVTCDSFEQGLAGIQGDRDTFFVIVTRGHRYDQVCLEAIARKEHAYIGMIGSRRRVGLVKEAVIEHGASPEVIRRVYTPIGLDIGAETPEEIAVAVMAEIIQVKNRERRSGGFTREILDGILKETDEVPDVQGKASGMVEAVSGTIKESEICVCDGGQTSKILATIIARKGSAPRQTGTKMLVLADGTCVGTIGGGCAEAQIIHQALAMLRSGSLSSRICHVDLTGQDAEDQGMVCGGTMEVLMERV